VRAGDGFSPRVDAMANAKRRCCKAHTLIVGIASACSTRIATITKTPLAVTGRIHDRARSPEVAFVRQQSDVCQSMAFPLQRRSHCRQVVDRAARSRRAATCSPSPVLLLFFCRSRHRLRCNRLIFDAGNRSTSCRGSDDQLPRISQQRPTRLRKRPANRRAQTPVFRHRPPPSDDRHAAMVVRRSLS